MNYRDEVIAAAQTMRLIGEDGALVKLDSLSAVDLAMELEGRLEIEIPADQLRPEHFASIDSICALLMQLKPS